MLRIMNKVEISIPQERRKPYGNSDHLLRCCKDDSKNVTEAFPLKVEVECASCILHRGYLQIIEATKDSSVQFKAMSSLTQLLAKEFKPSATPALLGTKRDRLVKKITGISDSYAQRKRMSNQKALEMLPEVESLILNEKSVESRFRKACLCSIVGNIMEFDIPGHTFNYDDINGLIKNAENDLVIDEISKIFNLTKKAKKIMYLTDNAGEIVFDTLLVRELKKSGAKVIVGVKGGPVLNDATMKDAKDVRMDEVADDVVTTGTDAVGLIPEECSKEFLALYNSSDMIVAKGMGHVETLTEFNLNSPHALLFRTKCNPVANFFKVKRDKNVAKLML